MIEKLEKKIHENISKERDTESNDKEVIEKRKLKRKKQKENKEKENDKFPLLGHDILFKEKGSDSWNSGKVVLRHLRKLLYTKV